MASHTTVPNQSSILTDDEDDDQQNSTPLSSNSLLSVEQGETRHVTITEAVGLDFNSFIPQADITSQVHFFSNIQLDSSASLAGLKNGDRILQINSINVTNLEHEDVRKLMQLMTPILLTVAHDPKYLLLLQQPIDVIEEKSPEPPPILTQEMNSEGINHQPNHLDVTKRLSMESEVSTATSSTKKLRYEIFNITRTDESLKEEPLKAKLCRLSRSKTYDGFGLVLKYQQHLHVIGEVEQASPSYRAGLRENDVILFVHETNVEKLSHDDVKVMIRALTLASKEVKLTVVSKSNIPKYKTFQEKGLIDWSVMGLEK